MKNMTKQNISLKEAINLLNNNTVHVLHRLDCNPDVNFRF